MTTSTTRKIAHNTIVQIIGKIVSTGLGLLAFGMMARYLGTEKFGWYITAISFLQFVGILIDFGLIPVTAQMLSEPAHDKTKLLQNLFGFRLVTAIIFFTIAPIVALFFPYPMPVKIAIAFSTISFVSIALNQILTGYYQTQLRMHVAAISEFVGRIVLVVGIWLLIRGNASFLSVMWLLVAATVIQTIILWMRAATHTQLSFRFDWPIWKAIMIKMWPIAISIIFNVVYLKGDIILLSLWRTQTEVGLYGSAYRVLDIITQLGMLMMGVMLPLMAAAWSRNIKEEFAKYYQQAFDMLMVFAVPMTIGALFLGEKVMTVVFGSDFAPAGYYLQLLSIAVFGVYLGAVFGHAAVAINRQKQTMWIYISDAILTLTGYLIFIPLYGAVGAAWMSVFSELYAGTMLFILIRKYSQVSLRVKTFGKILVAGLVMGLTISYFHNLHVLFIIPIGMIVYGVILLLIRGISMETIREITALKPN